MTNQDEFRTILDALPPKAVRSRLEPYAELIHELRRRGRTYREITHILSERCGIQTSRSTVNDFVCARSKKTRNLQKRGSRETKARPENSVLLPQTKAPTETGLPMDDIQKRIAALKSRPIPATEKDIKIFQYDPEQPLTLPSKSQKKESDQ
jgi:hypothetical protein